MAISVAVPVGEETADRLVESLTPRVRALKVAPYTDPTSELGPVISKQSYDKINNLIDQGIQQGAGSLACDSQRRYAGNPDRHANRYRFWLDDPRRG